MRRNWLLTVTALVALLGLIGGVGAAALWDPHEVQVAEWSRRIALNLLGAQGLAIADADNSLPIRADLRQGELPFTSVALGFRFFGLTAEAGRLPLLLWSLLGLGCVCAAVGRLGGRRAALYALVVLSTTPLYFLQPRVLFGEAVTLSTFAIAWSGLVVACLGPGLPGRTRAAFSLLAAFGLYAGFWCRGPIVSVAVPALAVGLAGVGARPGEPGARRAAWASIGVGTLALAAGVSGLALAQRTGEYSVFVGSAMSAAPALPTFDVALGNLAHAAFPWSALAPVALALVCLPGAIPSGERGLVHAAGLGLAFSLAASTWLAPWLTGGALPAASCYAVLVACALRSLETGALRSPLLGFATAATALIVGFDLSANPDKMLTAFGVTGVSMPEGLLPAASNGWRIGGGALALASVVLFYERDQPRDAALSRFQISEYRGVLETLQRVWRGNLVFALLVLEAALLGFLLLTAVNERLVPLPQLEGFGSVWRTAVAISAICVPLAPLVVLGAMLVRDVARLTFAERAPGALGLLPITRAQGVLLAFAALGATASLGLYPALARQLSPREAFDRYRELRRGTEQLGVLGATSEAARYRGVPEARTLDSVAVAFDWLTTSDRAQTRRWLVLRSADLPELNSLYRAHRQQNLPILDARSSELLLGSNRLGSGELDRNPLAEFVRDAPPPLGRPLHAVLGEQLLVLGWSVRSSSGHEQAALVPGEHYRFSICYRVLAPITARWRTFVHIDGLQRRFNADHEPLDGKYPLSFWRPNDVLVDSTDLVLEPNFSPGSYRVYFGMFSGERRLKVTSGPADQDRISAGTLLVR